MSQNDLVLSHSAQWQKSENQDDDDEDAIGDKEAIDHAGCVDI